MPGLCLLFGAVRALVPADAVAAAAPDATVELANEGKDGWTQLLVRWPSFVVSLSRLAPDSDRFKDQLEGLAAFVAEASQGTMDAAGYTLLTRVFAARHVIGVAVDPMPNAESLARVDEVLQSLATSLNAVCLGLSYIPITPLIIL